MTTDSVFFDTIVAIRGGDVATLQRLLADNPGLAASKLGGVAKGRTPLHVVADWPGYFPKLPTPRFCLGRPRPMTRIPPANVPYMPRLRFRYPNLSTNKYNVQVLRTAAALASATSLAIAAALATTAALASAAGNGFARDHDHMIGFGIQSASFAAPFGFHRFFQHKFRRAVFLDDAQRAVAVRTKRLHGVRIEGCAVAAAGQRQGGDDFAIDCTEDDTRGLAAAAAPTHREQNVILGIDGQARRPVTLFTEVEMAGHLEGFGVHHGDVVRVGNVKIEMARAVRGALLDGSIGAVRTDGLYLVDDRTVLGIDDEEVGGTMTQNKKVVSRGVEDIAVGARRWKSLDRFKRLRVEKSRGVADDQTSMVLRVDRDAMPGRFGQGARELVSVEIKDTDRVAAGDINPAVALSAVT